MPNPRADKRLYSAWANMKNRCNNPRAQDYATYGGRGIKVCERWANYDNFAADMGPHPGPGLTLDRKDNNIGYRPGNVRWASRKEQARNQRRITLTLARADTIRERAAEGETQISLAREFGVSKYVVNKIVARTSWR